MQQHYWYTTSEGSKKGPFSEEEIQKLIDQHLLQPSQRLRMEGYSDWTSLNQFPQFDLGSEKTSFRLPPLPLEEEEISLLPEVSLPEQVSTQVENPSVNGTIDFFGDELFDDEIESSWWKNIIPSMGKITVVTLLLLALGFSFWLVEQKTFSRPSGMRVEDYEKLLAVAKTPLSQGVKVAYAFSKDLNQIWMSSNDPREGQVELAMESIPEKILGPEEVGILAQTTYRKHLASFNQFIFAKGKKAASGFYRFSLSATRLRSTAPWSWWYKLTQTQEKLPLLQQEQLVLYSLSSEKIFTKKLEKYLALRSHGHYKDLRDLSEKYKTLLSLAVQLQELLQKAFSYPAKKGAHFFEDQYKRNVGVFLTTFLLDNEDFLSKSPQKFPDITQESNSISLLAKRMARFSALSLHELEQLSIKKLQQKQELQQTLSAEILDIRKALEQKEEELTRKSLPSISAL